MNLIQNAPQNRIQVSKVKEREELINKLTEQIVKYEFKIKMQITQISKL